jgi:F0F1-type ATP synthase assembly protein I
MSPWWVVSVQFLFGVAGVILTWWWGSDGRLIGSFACGVGVVWLPALFFVAVHGFTAKFASIDVLRFFVLQLLKSVFSVALIGLTVWKFESLNWPLFLGAMVFTLKVYWLALLFSPKTRVMVHL